MEPDYKEHEQFFSSSLTSDPEGPILVSSRRKSNTRQFPFKYASSLVAEKDYQWLQPSSSS